MRLSHVQAEGRDCLLAAAEANSLLPAGLSIVGSYVVLKEKMTVEKQATDLCICSWAVLQTYQQVPLCNNAKPARSTPSS